MADTGFFNHIMERLEPVGGITGRAMFGGYGIFHDGDMLALIIESTIYSKVGELNRDAYRNAESEQFMNMPYYEVPVEIMEDDSLFLEWARTSITVSHATAKKKKQE